MTYDLVALGETMFTLSAPPGETLSKALTLCVDHAGAESNTCVGLARLGFHVAWVSRLGVDPAGERILAALQEEGVDTTFVRRDALRPTGLMLKNPVEARVHYYRAGSAASALSPADLVDVPFATAKAVLVTGVTALLGPDSAPAGLALLRGSKGLRVVDPNLRAGLWGSARRAELVRPLLEACDIVIGGEGELGEILGLDGSRGQAQRCLDLGAREAVVRTSGGLVALEAGGTWTEIETRRDAAVDTIGAGDAFNAGFIAVRLRRGSMEQALQAGAACGRAVAQSLGDTAGFPRSLEGATAKASV